MKLAILNEADTSFITDEMPGRRKEFFQRGVENLRKYKEAGELTATEFKSVKEDISYGLRDAWGKLINEPYFWQGKYENIPTDVYDVIGNINVQLHTIPGSLKKARKTPDHEVTRVAIKFLEALEQISIDVKSLKDKIVKKKKAVVDKENAAAESKRIMLGDDDVQRVRSALEQITEDLKNDLYESNLQWISRLVEKWAEQYEPGNEKTEPYEFYRKSNPFGYMILQRVVRKEGDWRNERYVLNDNYKEYLEKEAKTMTQDMMNKFIYKNTQKLAEILVEKGKHSGLKTVTLRNANTDSGTIEGTLKLEFKDGSAFIVTSGLVWSWSRNGKQFTRYPTTFHQVIFPNGSKMHGRASEARMKDEFATQ